MALAGGGEAAARPPPGSVNRVSGVRRDRPVTSSGAPRVSPGRGMPALRVSHGAIVLAQRDGTGAEQLAKGAAPVTDGVSTAEALMGSARPGSGTVGVGVSGVPSPPDPRLDRPAFVWAAMTSGSSHEPRGPA